jgi:hypothetical protein
MPWRSQVQGACGARTLHELDHPRGAKGCSRGTPSGCSVDISAKSAQSADCLSVRPLTDLRREAYHCRRAKNGLSIGWRGKKGGGVTWLPNG